MTEIDSLLIYADPDQMAAERSKAKQMKRSAWWKNKIGQGKCFYCNKRFHPRELTMDHETPLVRGGRSTRGNLVPACKPCNQDKMNLPPGEWKARIEAFEKAQNGWGV
ncbi:MAG: HNH endonuclease [Magnetococcales bacterium]|nr:HNH endonuclease [Magnetococcales bacterium]